MHFVDFFMLFIDYINKKSSFESSNKQNEELKLHLNNKS